MHLYGEIPCVTATHDISPATAGEVAADAVHRNARECRQCKYVEHAPKRQTGEPTIHEDADGSGPEHAEQAHTQAVVHRLSRQPEIRGHEPGEGHAASHADDDRDRQYEIHVRRGNTVCWRIPPREKPGGKDCADEHQSEWRYPVRR